DIVGSTDLTQNKGDSHIQKIVRIHNLIVRQALTKYQGKEIKHTGDGIMASFASTTDAVESAAFIQKCIVDNNMHNPDMTFYLKIGLNVGEPIYEDDDLLGTAVQLSSRVCDQADEGQILVTDAVQALCKGGRIRFVNRGPFALKGFKEAMTLYEVDWRNSSATEKEGLSSDEMLLQAEEAGEDMEELNAGEAADGNAPVASEAGQPEDEQAEENVEAVESLSKEFRGEAEDDDFPPAPEDAPAEISKDEIAGEPEQVPTEETKEDPTEGKSVSSHKILR
ncbi:MAG: hypothetical protein OEY85_12740, partial [Rhodospirillales bacterium]|nr:hypothetical protein [Rhodospirillales bacterium]